MQKLIEYRWSFEDILIFADNHLLLICDSVEEIVRTILRVKLWCESANFILINIESLKLLQEEVNRFWRLEILFGKSVQFLQIPWSRIRLETNRRIKSVQ